MLTWPLDRKFTKYQITKIMNGFSLLYIFEKYIIILLFNPRQFLILAKININECFRNLMQIKNLISKVNIIVRH